MNTELDWYRITSQQYNEYTQYQMILKSFETQLECDANDKGYSLKYTIINGRLHRRYKDSYK